MKCTRFSNWHPFYHETSINTFSLALWYQLIGYLAQKLGIGFSSALS
jgi:uncharacterized membrane protein